MRAQVSMHPEAQLIGFSLHLPHNSGPPLPRGQEPLTTCCVRGEQVQSLSNNTRQTLATQ